MFLNTKLSFSGHESFTCKQFWLKKGFDYSIQNKKFTDPEAVVDLGVGKNMVASIRFWLKAFGLNDENDQPTEFARYIFGENGADPYIEDFGTLWLLHYYLIKTRRASIYSLFFNDFRKERFEFRKEHFFQYIKRISDDRAFNETTVNRDIEVFIRNYEKPSNKVSDIEDNFAGLLNDLNLILYSENNKSYRIENQDRFDLPPEIVLFVILDNELQEDTISFRRLLTDPDSPGSVFALNEDGLYEKLQRITDKFSEIVYSENAGIRVLQFKSKPSKWDVLNIYYGL